MRVVKEITKQTSRSGSRTGGQSAPVLKRTRRHVSPVPRLRRKQPRLGLAQAVRGRATKVVRSFITAGPIVSIRVTTHRGRSKPRTLIAVRYRSLLVAFLLLVIVGGLWASVQRTQADVATYTPTTCLGGWANPTKAQGEVGKDEPLESNNSALYAGGEQSLYCGNFAGSNIDNAGIESATLRLAWGQVEAPTATAPGEYIDAPVLHPVNETVPLLDEAKNAPTNAEPESLTPSVEALPLEEPAAASSVPKPDTEADVRAPEPAPQVEGESTGGVVPEVPVVPIEQPPLEVGPQSYFPKLFKIARAEEFAEPATTTHDASSASADSDLPTATLSRQVIDPHIFSLRYSLDGATWTEFGRVGLGDFSSEFTLPLSDVKDVHALQVGLEPVGHPNLDRPILLNGMTLELKYIARDKPDMPDPAQEDLLSVRSVEGVSLVKTQQKEGQQARLWVYDREGSPQWTPIATGDEVSAASPLLLVPGYAFWVSSDNQSLSAYRIKAKTYFSHSLTQYIAGEDTTLSFDNGRMLRLQDQQLVLYDSEGVVEILANDAGLNSEIEQLFKRGVVFPAASAVDDFSQAAPSSSAGEQTTTPDVQGTEPTSSTIPTEAVQLEQSNSSSLE